MLVCVRAWCVCVALARGTSVGGATTRVRGGGGWGGVTRDVVTGVDLGRTEQCQIERETERRSGPTDGLAAPDGRGES